LCPNVSGGRLLAGARKVVSKCCVVADCWQAYGRLCPNVVWWPTAGRHMVGCVQMSGGRLLADVWKVVSICCVWWPTAGRGKEGCVQMLCLAADARTVVSKCMPIFGTWYSRDYAHQPRCMFRSLARQQFKPGS
jgi:hypothetical protein